MIMECMVIVIFTLLFIWFVLGVDISSIISFVIPILLLAVLGVFIGVCMKLGWNLF